MLGLLPQIADQDFNTVLSEQLLPMQIILCQTGQNEQQVRFDLYVQLIAGLLLVGDDEHLEDLDNDVHGSLVGQVLDGLFIVGAADAADHAETVLELGTFRAAAAFGMEAVAVAHIVTFIEKKLFVKTC